MRTTDICRAAAGMLVLASVVVLAPAPAASQESGEHARVPTSHANVHAGPSTGRPVLVMVPQDTALPVLGRQGEWVRVQLSPELRSTGIVVRWYDDETEGWMHDSTVELVAEPR